MCKLQIYTAGSAALWSVVVQDIPGGKIKVITSFSIDTEPRIAFIILSHIEIFCDINTQTPVFGRRMLRIIFSPKGEKK
jgi:hypothetical protein